MKFNKAIVTLSWVYIVLYELLRGAYVFVGMPLAGGTLGSIVGLMIGTYALLLVASICLAFRPALAMCLLFAYLGAVTVVWFRYEIPSLMAFIRDRGLDYFLLVAFYGVKRASRSAETSAKES